MAEEKQYGRYFLVFQSVRCDDNLAEDLGHFEDKVNKWLDSYAEAAGGLEVVRKAEYGDYLFIQPMREVSYG